MAINHTPFLLLAMHMKMVAGWWETEGKLEGEEGEEEE